MPDTIDTESGWCASVSDAAAYASCSVDVIRQGMRSGQLPAFAPPQANPRAEGKRRRWHISKQDIDTYIRTCWEPFGGEHQ